VAPDTQTVELIMDSQTERIAEKIDDLQRLMCSLTATQIAQLMGHFDRRDSDKAEGQQTKVDFRIHVADGGVHTARLHVEFSAEERT
jgi:hypothetical protein